MRDGGKITPTAGILALMQSTKSGAHNTLNHSVPNQTGADKKAQEETVSENLPSVPDESVVNDTVQQETGAQAIPEISVISTFTSTNF